MYERSLHEAERILATDKDVIVPVKRVWQEVVKQGNEQGFEVPSLVDFETMLEADQRFEFMSSKELLDDGEIDPDDRAEEEVELEKLGFYSGDRVKLKKIDLTAEMLGGIIRQKVDRTMEALTKAWELRPEGDQDAEDQLLEILAKTQKLQKEVKDAFSEERMKEVSQALSGKEETNARKVPPKKSVKPKRKPPRSTVTRKKKSSPTATRKRKR
jgi:hypothetical protein